MFTPPFTGTDGKLTYDPKLRSELLKADGSKWMSVHRCKLCGRYWAEDTLDSGHASIALG